VPGLDGPEAVRRVKALRPELRVLGFLSHVQLELAEHAKAAGADEVMPRSRFSAHLPEILKRYAAGGA
jgi:DNA-binding NarL/FixJ family response regulator